MHNMTSHMKKHYHMLHAINQCSPEESKQLLRVAKPELIHAICDCIVNVVYGKKPISSYKKSQLRKKISVLKRLSNSKEPVVKKKEVTYSTRWFSWTSAKNNCQCFFRRSIKRNNNRVC